MAFILNYPVNNFTGSGFTICSRGLLDKHFHAGNYAHLCGAKFQAHVADPSKNIHTSFKHPHNAILFICTGLFKVAYLAISNFKSDS